MSIFTIADREEIVRRYLRGDRVRDIAKVFGCCWSYPRKLAKIAGLDIAGGRGTRQSKARQRRHFAAAAQMSFGA